MTSPLTLIRPWRTLNPHAAQGGPVTDPEHADGQYAAHVDHVVQQAQRLDDMKQRIIDDLRAQGQNPDDVRVIVGYPVGDGSYRATELLTPRWAREKNSQPADGEHRVVAHETGDTRHFAVVRRDAETDQLSDEEIVAKLEEWKRKQRHLRAVEDE